MDKITRRMGDGWHTYTIYTVAEALERDMVIVPWRISQAGDWALSDDGYVGECLRVFHSNAATQLITLSYGQSWSVTKAPMLYEERAGERNWAVGDRKSRGKSEARRTRTKNAISAYVTMLLSGDKVDWDVLGNIYRPDRPIPSATVRIDFKKQAFVDMIQQELEKVLLAKGSSPSDTIEKYQEAYDVARANKKPGVMVDVADRFSDFWNLKSALQPNGELPASDFRVLEEVEEDLQIAKEATNGE